MVPPLLRDSRVIRPDPGVTVKKTRDYIRTIRTRRGGMRKLTTLQTWIVLLVAGNGQNDAVETRLKFRINYGFRHVSFFVRVFFLRAFRRSSDVVGRSTSSSRTSLRFPARPIGRGKRPADTTNGGLPYSPAVVSSNKNIHGRTRTNERVRLWCVSTSLLFIWCNVRT